MLQSGGGGGGGGGGAAAGATPTPGKSLCMFYIELFSFPSNTTLDFVTPAVPDVPDFAGDNMVGTGRDFVAFSCLLLNPFLQAPRSLDYLRRTRKLSRCSDASQHFHQQANNTKSEPTGRISFF